MSDIVDDFSYRVSLVRNLSNDEAAERLAGLYEWLDSQPQTQEIVQRLQLEAEADQLLEKATERNPPPARTPEQIAGVGLLLLKKIHKGAEAWRLSHEFNIRPSFSTNRLQDHFDAVFERFISPALDFVERELQAHARTHVVHSDSSNVRNWYPLEITESLQRFQQDHPEPRRAAFVMMQFGTTQIHNSILRAIRSALSRYGIEALRADDKEYHDDLFGNVLTYIHGCSFGIAVFERLEADDFNPNVSLEVGYMRALTKSVCLLRDRTLKTLQTDLVGKLYKSFDPQDPEGTIPSELEKWLRDKDIISF